jgi:endonuclease/exonuclease/phosphatase family metal-dependent hydrolase
MCYRIGAAAVSVVALSSACAHTVNLTNPTTPVFEGAYGQAAVHDSTPPASIRVVTFNLKLARRIDRAIELFEQNDTLRHADIIALEEMNADGVERIARALCLNYAYYPASIHPSVRDYFGPAMLTPWPIERSWKVLLPHEGELRHQRRTATGAIIRVRGARIRAYATHLEMPLRITDEQRRDQVAAILADAGTAPEPVIVAGDLNSRGIGRFFEASGYHWISKSVGRTTLWFAFDHIFARGLTLIDSGDVGVVREVHHASDHRPVWALLKLEERPRPMQIRAEALRSPSEASSRSAAVAHCSAAAAGPAGPGIRAR